MIEIGHTEIKNNKIIFVYYKLPKPNWDSTLKMVLKNGGEKEDAKMGYNVEVKIYEASRREVEVKNVFWSTQFNKWIIELIRSQGITFVKIL